MASITKYIIPVDKLLAKEDPNKLSFKDTDELTPFVGTLGQSTAVSAIEFGVNMRRSGYNIYVMGESGTGRTSYVLHYLETIANKNKGKTSDWVYVNNFDNIHEPRVLKLPAGKANKLKTDFVTLIDSLLDTFPAAFEHPSYQQRKSAIEREFNQYYDIAIDKIEQEALRLNVAVFREAGALSFAPIKDGKTIEDMEFAQLPDGTREKFNNDIINLETLLNNELVELPHWKRQSCEQLRKLNHSTIDEALLPLFKLLEKEYAKLENILSYFSAMRQNLHEFIIEYLVEDATADVRDDSHKKNKLIESYAPNIIVAHDTKDPAPVIYETHPSYKNLFGRIEYASEMGALVTNYRHIYPGSLHLANGGYLVIESSKLLDEPFVWDSLKRALKERKLKIESPNFELGLVNTITLIPEWVELDVKIILIGSRHLYYLLQDLDPDFQEIFRVLVDFESHLDRNKKNIYSFAKLLKSRADDEGYPALTARAVARMVEQSSRLVENKNYLSAHIGNLFELLAEADYIRQQSKNRKITHTHIDKALETKAERTGRVNRELQKEMLEGSILIETAGTAIGKINGLTVLSVSDTSFGSPARITAAVYPGSQGIVDIEKEVQLGQAIHSKGVMILTGYLGARYAQKFPLAISASLAIEQSYGFIDGDSASLAELCCLMSALAYIPISQGIAVTGSINQHGQIQPVGGVNEKIEGYFQLCQKRGLNGEQGVIIPATNIRNLVLHANVVEAVRAKKFFIYGVYEAEEAMEILTGMRSGKLNRNNEYPKDTINRLVLERLKEIANLTKDGSN